MRPFTGNGSSSNMGENIGTTETHAVFIELKEPSPNPAPAPHDGRRFVLWHSNIGDRATQLGEDAGAVGGR